MWCSGSAPACGPHPGQAAAPGVPGQLPGCLPRSPSCPTRWTPRTWGFGSTQGWCSSDYRVSHGPLLVSFYIFWPCTTSHLGGGGAAGLFGLLRRGPHLDSPPSHPGQLGVLGLPVTFPLALWILPVDMVLPWQPVPQMTQGDWNGFT